MSSAIQSDPAHDAALIMARQSLYRFAAVSLLDPKSGAWPMLRSLRSDPLLEQAAELVRSRAARPATLALGEQPSEALDPVAVIRSLPASASELNDQYERTFGLLVAKACPPYETEYIDQKLTFQRSQHLADIAGFYRAFGFCPSDEHRERQDHIVLELEFMSLLLGMQRRVLGDGIAAASDCLESVHQSPRGMHRAQICCSAQRRFLQEHLAWWVPAFCRLLGREGQGSFYEALSNFLAALIPAERGVLGVDAATCGVAPSRVERPDECEGCQFVCG